VITLPSLAAPGAPREALRLLTEDLPHFGFAFPAGPVLTMQLHELLRGLDRCLPRWQLEHGKSANDFLGFDEWAVSDDELPLGETDAGASGAGKRPPICTLVN